MPVVIAVIGLIVLFLVAGWIAASVASANQAQAVIEVAKIGQIQASENWLQSANAMLLTIGLLVVIAILIGLVIYLIWRDRKRERELRDLLLQVQITGSLPGGKWAPGPNARFRRADQPALPAGGGMDNMFMQFMILKKLFDDDRRGSQQPDQNDPFRW